MVMWSYDHNVMWSYDHMIICPYDHNIMWSYNHMIIWLYDHMTIWLNYHKKLSICPSLILHTIWRQDKSVAYWAHPKVRTHTFGASVAYSVLSSTSSETGQLDGNSCTTLRLSSDIQYQEYSLINVVGTSHRCQSQMNSTLIQIKSGFN